MSVLMLIAVLGVFSGIAMAEKVGTIPNEGSVKIVDENGATAVANANDSLAVTIPDPVIAVDFFKDAENKTYIPGDIVDYRYYAKNTGTVEITSISVVDDMLGAITMSATGMKPGDEITGSKTMKVTDAMAGTSVTNFVTLKGKAGTEDVVINGSAVIEVVPFTPEIKLTKKFSVEDAKIGDVVQVTLTATNVGKISGKVTISDPMFDNGSDLVLNADGDKSVELVPGESVSVTRDYIVDENDLTNIVTVV